MLGAGWMNLASLVLGVVAWLLPLVCLVLPHKEKNRVWAAFCLASISACATALYFQICYQRHLVDIGDWSALMDTAGALVFVASVLLAVTLALNIVVWIVYHRKQWTGSIAA